MTIAQIRDDEDNARFRPEVVNLNGRPGLKCYNMAGRNWTIVDLLDVVRAVKDQRPDVFAAIANDQPTAATDAHVARMAALQNVATILNNGQCLIASTPGSAVVRADNTLGGVTAVSAAAYLRSV